ncbi:uncharacterized protein [Onthophagus taurus]|uniref:uncharacterized protein n=1 Tax=Onthophagus taurus TaxID=166361 RepID=UPI0039BE3AE8
MKLQLLLLSILSIKYLDATCDNGVYELGVSKDEKNQIVALHNYLRKQIANGKVKGQPRGVNLKRMSWDESLAEQAQNVANTCEFKHVSINDDRWSWVGQNLFNSMATNYNKKPDWKGVIQNSWFGEKDNYKYRAEYTKNVVDYTQLVWANTNKVGCGYTHFPIEGDFPYKKLYVCNYAPGGNIEGENPYKKGKSGLEEYRRRFPNRRIPNRQVFQTVFTRAGESGMFPSASIVSEKQQGLSLEHEENILDVAENNPGISTRRMAIQFEIPQTMVWKTLKRQGLNAFHLQKVQNLQESDYPLRLQFCQWIRENRRLLKCILFSDEAQFTRDGINNYHNNHRWSDENPHATQEHNFQHRFSINVWCDILNDQLFGPFVLDIRLTGEESNKMKFQLFLLALFYVEHLNAVCNEAVHQRAVSESDKKAIVDIHNHFRTLIAQGKVPGQPRGINLKRMKWDENLAREAQKIANTCEFAHKSVQDGRWSWVGQNLYTSSSTNYDTRTDWNGAITAFFNEHKMYKFGSGFSMNTGHYTQVVWAESDHVGCGYTHYENSRSGYRYHKLYVCNYGPGGNIVGQNPYEVGTSGCENLC